MRSIAIRLIEAVCFALSTATVTGPDREISANAGAIWLPLLQQIRLFEFERNWLSPVMAEWFCVMILLKNPALAAGISLAGDAARE
jgi:hypothetical protein